MFKRLEVRWRFIVQMAMMLSPWALTVIGSPLITPSYSQPLCPGIDELTPSPTTRTVELKQFGIRVTIPSNFRTILRNDDTVSIVAPGDFNLLQCIVQGMPAPENNAIAMDMIRLRPNPENLDLKTFILKDPTPDLSTSIERQTINGFDVLIRKSDAQGSELAYAIYRVDEIEGLLEVTAPTKIQLLDLLKRTQLLTAATTPSASQAEDNLILWALELIDSLGYRPMGDRETIVRQNNSDENRVQSTVTITQEGLLDDSIVGQQFIIQFQKNSTVQWEVLSLQKKRMCQVGRGAQDYSTEQCL